MSAVPFVLLGLLVIPQFQLLFSSAVVLKLDKECKQQCDSHRPEGNRAGSFRFRCGPKEDKCRKSCGACDARICDSSVDPRAYYCPPLEFPKGRCKERCEANRPIGHREFFDFDCKYDSSPDKGNCSTCDNGQCPSHVCTSKNAGKYNCPAISFEGICQKRCDKDRELGKVFGYVLECSEQADVAKCAAECKLCPSFVCQKDKGTKAKNVKYNCPVPQLIGYDECREICEKHRADEDEEYILSCNDHYDKPTCEKLCTKCPKYVCDPKAGDNLIYCPAKDDTFFPGNGESRSSSEAEHVKKEVNWYKTTTFILAILLVLVVIATTGFVAVTYWKFKAKSGDAAATPPTLLDEQLPRQERRQQMSASAPALFSSRGASGDKRI